MNLAKYLCEECIQVSREASNKTDALKAIARLAKNSPILPILTKVALTKAGEINQRTER